MKFDQLIEHNMRYAFLEKSLKKCGGRAILRPSCKSLAFTSCKVFSKNHTHVKVGHTSEFLFDIYC